MAMQGRRTREGTISVIKKYCPNCSHNRAISKPRGIFCARCKKRII